MSRRLPSTVIPGSSACYVESLPSDQVIVTKRKARPKLIAGMVLALAALVGCASAGSGVDGTSGTYVAIGPDHAQLLQLTATDTSATGSIDLAELSAGEVKTHRLSFSGTISGDQLTLSIDGGLGIVTNLTGRFADGSVILSVPQRSGEVQEVTFSRSSAATYNSALAKLQEQADALATAEAEMAHQAALDDAAEAAARHVRRDIAELRDASFGSTGLEEDLKVQRDDVDVMRDDEATARAESDPEARCATAEAVVADAEAVEADYEQVLSDHELIKETASELRAEIGEAKSHLKDLESALTDNPQYVGSVPSEADVDKVTSAVDRLIDRTLSRAKAAVAEAKSVADEAMQEAEAFRDEHCT